MKATLYRNIDLVRIPIKAGVSEYYLPQNVDWANEHIDRLAICMPENRDYLDPVDGTTAVYDMAYSRDAYVSLYNKEEKELMHEVYFDNLLSCNNHPVVVDDVLNLSLCRINFTQTPAADATLLIYVYWGSRVEEDYDMPNNSVTAVFPLAANAQITFQELINQYIHALPGRVKGITVWYAEDTPIYITLRDHKLTYILQSLCAELAKPADYQGGGLGMIQEYPLLLDNLDIDFDYSRIRNASANDIDVKLTFYF